MGDGLNADSESIVELSLRITMIAVIVSFVATGMLTGLLAGLLGIGGGVVIVPALSVIFVYFGVIPAENVMHVAVSCSLAVIVFTALSTVRTHVHVGQVLWPLYYRLVPGVVVGVLMGVLVADLLPGHIIKMLFGLFLLIVGLRMLFMVKPPQQRGLPTTPIFHAVSTFVGFKSGLLGIGGGSLMIPFLTRCNIEMRKAQAVSSLCSLSIAITGSLISIYTGWDEHIMVNFTTGYVYWPAVLAIAIPSMICAPLGTRLAYRLPVKHLKRVFAVFLLFNGTHMLLT